MDTFKDRLQYVMAEKKITRQHIMKKTNYDSAQISRWLSGEVTPRTTTIIRLTDVINCSWRWLQDGTGEPFPEETTGATITATNQTSTGNGISIQAGRDAKRNIVEGGAGGLSQEEQELIDLIRQYGGPKAIESFKERLLKIKTLLEDK